MLRDCRSIWLHDWRLASEFASGRLSGPGGPQSTEDEKEGCRNWEIWYGSCAEWRH